MRLVLCYKDEITTWFKKPEARWHFEREFIVIETSRRTLYVPYTSVRTFYVEKR